MSTTPTFLDNSAGKSSHKASNSSPTQTFVDLARTPVARHQHSDSPATAASAPDLAAPQPPVNTGLGRRLDLGWTLS